jgi:hypothetical protein
MEHDEHDERESDERWAIRTALEATGLPLSVEDAARFLHEFRQREGELGQLAHLELRASVRAAFAAEESARAAHATTDDAAL